MRPILKLKTVEHIGRHK